MQAILPFILQVQPLELDDENPLDEPPEEELEEAAQTIFWKLLPVPPLL